MTHWFDEYQIMLEDIEARSEKLTEWEATFCDSLHRQFEAGRAPSPKQVDVLGRLWEEVTAGGSR